MKNKIIISTFDSIGNPDYNGGGAIAIHEIAMRLVRRYDVTIIAGKYRGSHDHVQDGVSYRYIGTSSISILDQGLFHILSLIQIMLANYDLWIENFTPPTVTGLIPIFSHKPVIGLAHMLPGQDMNRKYHLPFTWIEKFGLRRYQTIIATSDYFAQKIKVMNPRAKVVVIPNGINRIKIGKRTKKHFLFVGRIEINQKGLDLLIGAYKGIPLLHKYPLVIAGSGSTNQINKLNKLIGKFKNIQYIGRISDKDKEKLYSSSIAIIVPSRFETFSMVAGESLVNSIPLISFAIDGLRWISIRARWVADGITSDSLANTMLNCISRLNEAKRKSIHGREIVKEMTWDNATKQYLAVIKEHIHE